MNETLRTIGYGRALSIALLLAFSIGTAAALYYHLYPEQEIAERELKTAESENRRLRAEIEDIPRKFAEYQENQRQYDALVRQGFINDQDRVLARKALDVLRRNAGVEDMRYSVAPLTTITENRLMGSERELVKSTASVDVSSDIDLPLLMFKELVLKSFPGVPVLKRFEIGRELELNDSELDRLAKDEEVAFMSGMLEFDWYTIAPILAIRPHGEEIR